MNTLKFDLSEKHGDFKPLNAVNNGPVYKRHANDLLGTSSCTELALKPNSCVFIEEI